MDCASAAKLLSKDEARRIAANIAKLLALAQSLIQTAVAERYLVRVPSIFPSPFTATCAVCADGSNATSDTFAAGVDSPQQVLIQPSGVHTKQTPQPPPQPPQPPQPQPLKRKPPHLQPPWKPPQPPWIPAPQPPWPPH